MKTVYSNTAHPKLVKWSSIVGVVVGFVCVLLDGDLQRKQEGKVSLPLPA